MADPKPSGASGTLKIENTEKRDLLQATELRYQKLWQEERVFESDAPSCNEFPPDRYKPEEVRAKVPKYFCTMAYPYVNGTPHLGHAFTVSKVEFASRVARARGKRTLYPQGYHATGMPILACADKLVNEQRMFGKDFERYQEIDSTDEATLPAPTKADTKEDITKFTNLKKGKAALKSIKAKYQFQVMLSLGIPREEIHKFADARYWLQYFPQLWQKHLVEFGCGIDWRRSFITTDINPYYNSFVEWQMRRLRQQGKIQFGKRYTVYSPKDGQPCLDHDRSVGEAIGVQEYLALKCKVQKWSRDAEQVLKNKISPSAKVYMVPATLRPETMYGQTNIFVSPVIKYGIFQVSEDEFYVISERAARNMAFQGIFPEWGLFSKVADIQGTQIIGSLVHAPLSRHENVYVVPMDTIKEAKGTGVVTSVPSDSPDDFAMTLELSKKAQFYGIEPEMVDKEILPIINTPGYGNLIAEFLVKEMKINSPKDLKQLAEAKAVAYKQGFYNGTMTYGEFAGKSVQEAKNLVRQSLLNSHLGFTYCEVDGLVISRSGDECVAAFLDQWYLTYGDTNKAWRSEVLSHISSENFNAFSTATKNALEQTLDWMSQWAVTRQYGLGTKLPWDNSQLVESLSDSTIYMAYYTIAHFLHSDIYGTKPGLGNIKPGQMTDEVWNFVFALHDQVSTNIEKDTLEAMRREFTFWYPLDVRCSGKDLINNHIIFFLYIHQAIWNQAPEYLPKGVRLNGHVTLNGEKMSKSTGNFLTLDAAVKKFGTDATRIALADGGDGFEDANFEETVANASILKLYELRKWIEESVREARILKEGELYSAVRDAEKIKAADTILRANDKTFWDLLFENEMNCLVRETICHYDLGNYKAALKSGFYDFTAARDVYRFSAASTSIGMHQQTLNRYIELQASAICVIAPHWAEYIWRDVLKKPTTIQNYPFPTVPDPDPTLSAASEYIRSTMTAINAAEGSQIRRIAKGKTASYDPKQAKRLNIYLVREWPAWQTKYIDLVQQNFDGLSLDMKSISNKMEKTEMKKAMPFVQGLKRRLESGENHKSVFDRKLGFDEAKILQEMVPSLKATVTKLMEIKIVEYDEKTKRGFIVLDGQKEYIDQLSPVASSAEPGHPSFEFSNL